MRWYWAWDVIAAAIGVAVGAVGGAFIGQAIGGSGSDGWGDLAGLAMGLLIGAAGMPPLALLIGGRIQRRPGHFWLALLGSCAAVGLVLALNVLTQLPISALLVIVGAVVGFRRAGR